jgi:hypothetical protein
VISENEIATEAKGVAKEDYSQLHGRDSVVEWDHVKFPPPTEDEKITLRKVPGDIPWIGYSLCIVEFAERASYYGAVQVFANFLQKPLPEGTHFIHRS